MIVLLIVIGFFCFSGAIGLIVAAVLPGGFRSNVGGAMGLFVGAPLLIAAVGVVVGLVIALAEFLF